MQIKKSTLIIICILTIIFLNERMFYMLETSSSLHVIGLLLIAAILFLVYIRSFFTKRYLFRGVILCYVLLNIVSIIITNFKFGQPIDLAIIRYKYIFVVLLYFPLCMMIYRIGIDKVKKVIIIITSILSIFYIIQSVLYPSFIFLNVNYADRFGFPRFFDGAYFITIGLFLTFAHLYNNLNKFASNKYYYFAFSLQMGYLVFIAQTRSSIVPIILIFTLLLIAKLRVNNILSTFKILLLFCAGAIILSPYLGNIIDSVETDLSRSEGTAYIRIQAREYMEEKIIDNPLFGIGLYNSNYSEGNRIDGSTYKYYPEDIGVFGFTFQYGFLGLILYIVMMSKFIYFTFKIFQFCSKRSIFYIIFCLYSCFQSPFTIPLNVDNTLIYLIMIMAFVQIDYKGIYDKKKLP